MPKPGIRAQGHTYSLIDVNLQSALTFSCFGNKETKLIVFYREFNLIFVIQVLSIFEFEFEYC